MRDRDYLRTLLIMTEKDLKALKDMRDVGTFADEIFGFHAQQAVEKSLKAWLVALGVEYPLTHNIATLLTMLKRHGCEPEIPFKYIDISSVDKDLKTIIYTQEIVGKDAPSRALKGEFIWHHEKEE